MDKKRSSYGVLDYLDNERSGFEKNLLIARESFDPEGIHQFRLSLKRIRSLFHLLEFVLEDKFDADVEFVPFRSPFKAGGVLRDIHVHLEMIGECEQELGTQFDKTRDFLFFQQEPAERRLLRNTDRHLKKDFVHISKLVKKRLNLIFESEFNQRSFHWVVSELSYLKDIHGFIMDPTVFHRFRRHSKETFYMIDFINNYTTGNIEIKGSLKELKEIARKIGTWHDHHNLILRIRYIRLLSHDQRLKIYKECQMIEDYYSQNQKSLFNQLAADLDNEELFQLK